MKRRKLLVWLLFGLVAAFGVAIGLLLRQPPENRSDVINLAGGLFGASITVIGAILVLEWDRQSQGVERRRIFAALIEDIEKWRLETMAPTNIAPGAAPAHAQYVSAQTLLRAIDRAKEARQWFPPTTIGMVRAYSTVGNMTVNLDGIKGELRGGRMFGGVTDLSGFLGRLEHQVVQALAELQIHEMPIGIDVD